MAGGMAGMVAKELGEKCERLTKAMLIALDTLEEIPRLASSKHQIDGKRLVALCYETLALMETALELDGTDKEEEPNG